MSEQTNDDLGVTFQLRKNGDIQIFHHGVLAATLRGEKAADFVRSPSDAQQLMARLTGNYKRGNERTSANYPRNCR